MMATQTAPLLGNDLHRAANVTTQHLSRNLNPSRTSPRLNPLVTPSEAPYHFDLTPSPPSVWPFPVEVSRPLRRKPSSSQLLLRGSSPIPARDRPLAPFAAEQVAQQFLQASPFSHLPPPPSPSLSSTITTLHSGPTPSPVSRQADSNDRWEGPANGHVFTKRKFSFVKPAKRLPRHISEDWLVYAAVVEGESERVPEDIVQKNGRSVRFTGVDSEDLQGASGEERDTTTASTFTLSKFKFPAPPGQTWTDTFGHLPEPTPPSSPATVYYKGASFDLVNPHASLLLGKHKIETPAEIDGLLDDYFYEADMPYNHITGEYSSPTLDQELNSSRRGRTLFTDTDSARRAIMRMPSLPMDMTRQAEQESPLARQTAKQPMMRGQPNIGEGIFHPTPPLPSGVASDQLEFIFPDPLARPLSPVPGDDSDEYEGEYVQDRAADSHRTSILSDPFDLNVSDDDAGPQYHNIDGLIATGNSHEQQPAESVGDYTETSDPDAESEAGLNTPGRDSTLGNILGAYDRTSGNISTDHEFTDFMRRGGSNQLRSQSPSSSIELARAIEFAENRRDPHAASERDSQWRRNDAGISWDNDGPPVVLPPRAHIPAARVHAPLYYGDCTELPTSEQTYGPTDELLGLTPAAQDHRTFTHSGGEGDVNYAAFPEEYYHHDMPNLAPSDSAMAFAAPEIPQLWSDIDMRRPSMYTLRPAHAIANRLSNRFTVDNDAAWEDIPIDQQNDGADEGHRISVASYANISDNSAIRDMPLPPAKHAQSPLKFQSSPCSSIGAKLQRRNKFIPLSGESDHEQSVHRAKQIIGMLIDEKRLGQAHISTQTDSRDLCRDLEHELELVRQQNPIAFKEALNAVVRESSMSEEPLVGRPSSSKGKGKARYDPDASFGNIVRTLGLDDGLSLRESVARSRASSITKSIGTSYSPARSNGLSFSNSVGTFQTLDADIPPLPASRNGGPEWSPLAQSSHRALRTRTPSTLRTVPSTDIELQPLTRTPAPRSALRSQTRLRELQLGSTNPYEDSTTMLTPTHQRLTDLQLAAQAKNWDMAPRSSPSLAQGRLAIDLGARNGSTARLIDQEATTTSSDLRLQEKISRHYFHLALLCPLSAFLFGIRYFDSFAAVRSQGRVEGMKGEYKQWALWVAVPLGMLAYAFVGVGVALVVLLTKG
ncbi:hypothetical protein LTR62_007066 [Meristemomyces frigidus]|uniref:Uncharacterized protein n=1 Tax=Meristemomyces frigidus TaxID=1508187 RepID=A0AAN7TMS5_9PEZI|nr:hypothetical protein LTR62_007066 [Meristemomyces frigidus]